MYIAVYVPLLCSLLFAAAGPRLALRHLTPRAGLWTLTLGGGVAAVASTWSLALLAGTLLDETMPAAAPRRVAHPVNDVVAVLAAVLLVAALGRLGYTVATRIATHRRLRRYCGPGSGPIVVVADPAPDAFALPGAGGRIVVSRGMLAALSPGERRVLFAHERAHLRQRHHWHSAAVQAAAAVNPLLIPVRGAGVHLCERCADETAAAEVGDRDLAASSLARAALAVAAVPGPVTRAAGRRVALGYHETGVAARVVALRRDPAAGRRGLGAALPPLAVLAVAALAVVADVDATGDFLSLILHTVHIGL